MKWVIAGGNGMLAQDVVEEARARQYGVNAFGKDTLSILNFEQVQQVFAEEKPDVVVNCAAWTAVDDAETNSSAAFATNATGAQNLARAASEVGAKFVQVSTDYVFDGNQHEPYAAGALLNPLGVYGSSKAAGEWAAQVECLETYVVRTAWLYGRGGKCFPKTIGRVLLESGSATVVDDQHGQPTWTRDVARLIGDLVEKAPPGIYHATSTGEATWFDFSAAIAESLGLSPSVVEPISSSNFPTPAPRPAWSALSHDTVVEAGVEPIGHWRERWALAAAEILELES